VKSIAAGANHSLALKDNGEVWTWGWNDKGQLGNNTNADRKMPVQVFGPDGEGYLTDVKAIAAGLSHSIALKGDDTAWAWGQNQYGQMGDGTIGNTVKNTPVFVPINLDAIAPVPGGNGTITTANVTYKSLTLNWTKATDDVSAQSALKYYIYKKIGAFTMKNGLPTDGTLLNPGGTLDITTYNVSGLSASTSYNFIVLVEDGAGNNAAYTAVSKTTAATPFAGTAKIDITSPKIGDTLTGSLVGGNGTGTLSYQWKANGINVGTNSATYVVMPSDLNKSITVEISSSTEAGTLTSEPTSAVVKKAAPAQPAPPTVLSKTSSSVTLATLPGHEYSMDGNVWQTNGEFNGLSTGISYIFYQRVAETDSAPPSALSPALSMRTEISPLSGTAVIDITSPKVGDTLTASINGGNNTGVLSYKWKVDGTSVSTNSSIYVVSPGDLNRTITVEITSSAETGALISATTSAVNKKAAPSAPAAPTVLSKTNSSVTLVTFNGYEYSMDGILWQTGGEFNNLSPGTVYKFYQRVAETDSMSVSVASPALSMTTNVMNISGTAVIDITSPKVGDTLTCSIVGGSNTGVLTYQWKANGTIVGSNSSTYPVAAGDQGKTITVEVTSSAEAGTLTSGAVSVATNKVNPAVPAAPTVMMKTNDRAILVALIGHEYSMDGIHWQYGGVFNNLSPGTVYTFYQRVAETDSNTVSVASPALIVTTDSTVNVKGGTASHSYGPAGTKVILTPEKAPDGKRFKEWRVISGNVTATDNTLILGSANVEVEAVWEDAPDQDQAQIPITTIIIVALVAIAAAAVALSMVRNRGHKEK
jgi:hypothetical protein